MKATLITTVVAALACALSLPLQAGGDPVKGRDKNSMCAGCHGIPGWKTAYPATYRVPKLGGQHEDYIVAALKAYRSGERSHPSMRAIAASLSEEDMQNLAAYYASSYSGPSK
ncbi:MAG: cytochrome c [Pseudomonadota bacterium]